MQDAKNWCSVYEPEEADLTVFETGDFWSNTIRIRPLGSNAEVRSMNAPAPNRAFNFVAAMLSDAVPLIVGSNVILSVAERPVSCVRAAAIVGAATSGEPIVRKRGSVGGVIFAPPIFTVFGKTGAAKKLSALAIPLMTNVFTRLENPPVNPSSPSPSSATSSLHKSYTAATM